MSLTNLAARIESERENAAWAAHKDAFAAHEREQEDAAYRAKMERDEALMRASRHPAFNEQERRDVAAGHVSRADGGRMLSGVEASWNRYDEDHSWVVRVYRSGGARGFTGRTVYVSTRDGGGADVRLGAELRSWNGGKVALYRPDRNGDESPIRALIPSGYSIERSRRAIRDAGVRSVVENGDEHVAREEHGDEIVDAVLREDGFDVEAARAEGVSDRTVWLLWVPFAVGDSLAGVYESKAAATAAATRSGLNDWRTEEQRVVTHREVVEVER